MMSREQLLTPIPLKQKTVTISGGDVTIRQLSHSEAAKWDMWQRPNGKLDEERKLNRDLKLITMCVIDSDGQLILTEDDIPALSAQPSDFTSELSYQVMLINGFLVEVEDLAGKSDS